MKDFFVIISPRGVKILSILLTIHYFYSRIIKMKGIEYIKNNKNQKVAVQIDLQRYGKLWEDFYDVLIAESRKNEEKIPLDKVISDLQKKDKLDESL